MNSSGEGQEAIAAGEQKDEGMVADQGHQSTPVVNPYDFRSWWTAIQGIPNNEDYYPERAALYQRALSYLPGSYKLWYNFLKESRQFVNQFELEQGEDQAANAPPSNHQTTLDLHEASLKFMYNMPRIWLDYAEFAAHDCHLVTQT